MTDGAMTLAEGDIQYKTDVGVVFGNSVIRKNVLRTTLHSLAEWKAKYAPSSDPKNVSPFEGRLKSVTKKAAYIDGEIWVFGINATSKSDLISAVDVATQFYKVLPAEIIGNVYVKNLNIDGENGFTASQRVEANERLYSSVTSALSGVSSHFGIQEDGVKLYVFSNNSNEKIPQKNLHKALKKGGAKSVSTDSKTHNYWVGSNCGEFEYKFVENLHMATIW